MPPGRTWVRTTMDQARWLVRDTPETKPITVDASYMAEWFSWVSFPFCSPPRRPLPNKVSCFVSLCCLLGRFTSECQTRAHSWALEGVPLPVTIYGLYLATLLPNTINPISQFETILVRSQTKMHIHSKKQHTQPWHTCNKETRGEVLPRNPLQVFPKVVILKIRPLNSASGPLLPSSKCSLGLDSTYPESKTLKVETQK